MRTTIKGLALAITVLAPAAHADFVIAGAPAPTASRPTLPPSGGAVRPRFTTTTRSAPPRFSTAYGFGDQVKLSFAVRQIVPKAVKVSYGRGADPNALVDWSGGKPWNQVLRAAIARLGLHLVMARMAVEIRK